MDSFPLTSLAILLPLVLVGCDKAKPPIDRSTFETVPAEAVIRHLHSAVPEIPGDHIYTIVVGEIGETWNAASDSFTARFENLGVKFVNADKLLTRQQDLVPYDPDSELSPIFLQIISPANIDGTQGSVDAAWAYKRKFQKLKIQLKKSGQSDAWEVVDSKVTDESLDGTWIPDWQKRRQGTQ